MITGGEPLTLHDLIRLIHNEIGVAPVRRAIPGAPLRLYKFLNDMVCACGGGQLPRFDRIEFFLNDRIFNLSRARSELGYFPKMSMKDAVHRTVEWYRVQGYL